MFVSSHSMVVCLRGSDIIFCLGVCLGVISRMF